MIYLRRFLAFPLLLFLTVGPLTNAKCCFPTDATYLMCLDGTHVEGWCCGYGPCNIFCCGCAGGCRHPPTTTTTKPHGISANNADTNEALTQSHPQYNVCTAATGSSIFNGDEDCAAQLFHSIDLEGTGRISLAQYLEWTRSAHADWAGGAEGADDGLDMAREYFYRFDADGDGYVSASEMHTAQFYNASSDW